MDSSRAQRLLLAKKKLKKFQHEQHSGQREDVTGSSHNILNNSGSQESEGHLSDSSASAGLGLSSAPKEMSPEVNVADPPLVHFSDASQSTVDLSTVNSSDASAEMLQLNNENYQPSGATAVSLDFTNDISNQLIQQNNENYVPSGSVHTVSLDFMNDISGQSQQRVVHKSNSGNELPGASGWATDPAAQPHLQTITMSGILELKVEMAALKDCVSQYRQEIVHLNELLQSEKRKGNSYELEKSNMAAMNQKLQGKIIQLTIENEKLSAQDSLLRQEIELLRGDNSVLSGKLITKDSEVTNLQSKLSSLASELSLARVNLEQMKNSSVAAEPPPDYDLLTAKCNAYANESGELRSRIFAIKNDLEISNEEHQRYVQATTLKLREMEQQLTSLFTENRNLLVKEASLEQDLVKAKAELNSLAGNLETVNKQLETCRAELTAAQGSESDRAFLQQKYADVMRDNDHLVDLIRKKDGDLESRDAQVSHLNEQLVNLQAEMSQFSKEKYENLLATLQSDRVATSRALAQNKQMKERLLELEGRFMHVMNEKLVLTEELESVRRSSATPGIVSEAVETKPVAIVAETDTDVAHELGDPPSCIAIHEEAEEAIHEVAELQTRLKKALEDLAGVSEERSILQDTVKELIKELQGKASKSKRLISLIDKRLSHFDKERHSLRKQIDELLVLLTAFIDSEKTDISSGNQLLQVLTNISDNPLIKLDGAYVDGQFYRCAHCMGMPRVV